MLLRIFLRVLFLSAALFAALASALPALAAKRVALVIGNAAYENVVALRNPRNDAEDVSGKLEKLGFEVTVGTDLSLDAMRRKIREFVTTLPGSDVALFFYAGHGLQVDGKNYMAPLDARLTSYDDLEFEALPMELVLSAMERNSKTNLIFLDACRNNPLAENLARSMGTRSTAVGRGLAPVDTGVGTLISFATQPGNVALDGTGRNSPFTEALLRHLGRPGQDITRSMVDVRRDVLASTGGKQVPWDSSSLTGELILQDGGGTGNSGNAGSSVSPAIPEDILRWNRIKNDQNGATFQSFIDEFPNSDFADLAKAKLAMLMRPVYPKYEEMGSDAVRVSSAHTWGAYAFRSDIPGKIKCYGLSVPVEKSPSGIDHGDIYFLMTPKDGSYEPQFVAGYPLQKDRVSLTIDGRTYKFFTEDKLAWALDKSDEPRISEALANASGFTIDAVSSRGTKTRYSFNLEGFKATDETVSGCS